jgi:hypothetical protein
MPTLQKLNTEQLNEQHRAGVTHELAVKAHTNSGIIPPEKRLTVHFSHARCSGRRRIQKTSAGGYTEFSDAALLARETIADRIGNGGCSRFSQNGGACPGVSDTGNNAPSGGGSKDMVNYGGGVFGPPLGMPVCHSALNFDMSELLGVGH